MTIIYRVFSTFDWGIYSLVSMLFNLIFDIADVKIFKSTAINDITVKIYVILCVIVIFKVTIACIQYLINPDTFSDKEKGMGGILKKVLISLALIAVVPVLFSFAREIQQPLSEAIPEVILGTTIDESERNNAGDTLARITLFTFIRPRESGTADPLTKDNAWTLDSFTGHVNDGCNFWGANCKYNYQWYFSIPVGIFLLYILLSMGIDIAVRAIKFGILEILAPICISSYIMKKDTFTKWYKTCIKVYTDLFIRLAIVYFIIFFVSLLAQGDIEISSGDNYFLTKVFVILGVLFFAKNAPKFICDVLGLDSSGDLKDMFKRTGALAGTAWAAGKTIKSNLKTEMERQEGKGIKGRSAVISALKSAAAGAGSATGRGLKMAFQGKGFKDTRNDAFQQAITARDKRNDRKDNLYNNGPDVPKYLPGGKKNPEYYGKLDYLRDRRRSNQGIPSSEQFIKARYDVIDKIAQTAGSEKSFGAQKMNETPSKYSIGTQSSAFNSYLKNNTSSFKDAAGNNITNADIDDIVMSISDTDTLANAQLGSTVTLKTKSGKTFTTKMTSELQAASKDAKQDVEKKTSYIKTAELLLSGDATATMNHQNTMLQLKANKTMLSQPEVFRVVKERFEKASGRTVNNIDDLLRQMDSVKEITRLAGESKEDYDARVSAQALIDNGIIQGVKDAYEALRTQEYSAAQAAEVRYQKSQKASQDNKPK